MTVYWEYQKGVQASEDKKAQERRERQAWEDAAERQREVRRRERALPRALAPPDRAGLFSCRMAAVHVELAIAGAHRSM